MFLQVLEGEAYTAVADVWGLGIVALHVANGEIPRRGTAVRELMRMVVALPAPKIDKPEKWTPAFSSFVARCLVKDPAKRATCSELLKHEWVTGVVQDTEVPTRSDMRRRTIGRTSLYNSPHKRATVPPRAGAATPARVPQATAATPVKQNAPPVTPVKQTPSKPQLVEATPPVAEKPKTQEELIQELEGWKKLALKLMEERDAMGKK